VNPDFYEILAPFKEFFTFTIPWYLTWFSHNLGSSKELMRIFDFLLSSEPYMIVLLVVAVICETESHFEAKFKNKEIEVLFLRKLEDVMPFF